jgi:hypothetical protein
MIGVMVTATSSIKKQDTGYVFKSSFKLKNDRISICRYKLLSKCGCDYFLKCFLFENTSK